MSREEPTHTETDCDLRRETDAAIQICTKDSELIWLPFSQVKNMLRVNSPMSSSITMTRWIAQQKGLI